MKTIVDKDTSENSSKPFLEWPEVMTIPDVIDCTGLPLHDVYSMFNLHDFPQVCPGKKGSRKVGKYALREWINKGALIDENRNQHQDIGLTQQTIILVCESVIQALTPKDPPKDSTDRRHK